MVKLYEETNFESERDNSHLHSPSSFPSSDKEIEIQKYLDKNRQYSSDVQHQQKLGAKNLYHTGRKIWKLSERNSLALKAMHIPGRINVIVKCNILLYVMSIIHHYMYPVINMQYNLDR
jgi:hypothetical protein